MGVIYQRKKGANKNPPSIYALSNSSTISFNWYNSLRSWTIWFDISPVEGTEARMRVLAFLFPGIFEILSSKSSFFGSEGSIHDDF